MPNIRCQGCQHVFGVPVEYGTRAFTCPKCRRPVPTSPNGFQTSVPVPPAEKRRSVWTRQLHLSPAAKKLVDRVWWIVIGGGCILAGVGWYLGESAKYANDETVAKNFMGSWCQGAAEANSALDSRSPGAARELLGTVHVNSFDGIVTDLGDNEITVYATGAQYRVHDFRVAPVVDIGALHYPVPMTISVSTESHKVFCVKPDQLK